MMGRARPRYNRVPESESRYQVPPVALHLSRGHGARQTGAHRSSDTLDLLPFLVLLFPFYNSRVCYYILRYYYYRSPGV